MTWALLPLWAVLASAAPAHSAGPAWDEFDRRMSEAAEAQAALGRCVEDRRILLSSGTPPACWPTVSVDTVLADPALKKALSADLVVRQMSLALLLERPEPCDILADLPGQPESGQHICRRLYAMGRFSQSLISGAADAPESCRQWCRLTPITPPPPEDLIEHVCSSLVKQDFQTACSAIWKWRNLRQETIKDCHWEMRSLLGLGEEEFCTRNYRPGNDVCAATALYRKARESADAGLCGGLPSCLALLGEGGSALAAADAQLREHACAYLRGAGKAPSGGIARLDEDCASVRAEAVRRLDSARALLTGGRAAAPRPERQAALSRLEAREKELEAAYAAAPAPPSVLPAERSPYAGEWSFQSTPVAVSGCCGTPGPDYLGRERLALPVSLDAAGRFLLFTGKVTLTGSVDPSDGRIKGVLVDPYCGKGEFSGVCRSLSECSGSYSQSSPAGADGVVNSESGSFRLLRP